MKDIVRNCASHSEFDDSGFISLLHESGIWNDNEYWKLDHAIIALASQYGSDADLPRGVVGDVAGIFSYIMGCFSSHFNPNDGFEIKNLDNHQICIRRERVQRVFEGLFQGHIVSDIGFDYSVF